MFVRGRLFRLAASLGLAFLVATFAEPSLRLAARAQGATEAKPQVRTLHVFAAASLTEAFGEIGKKLEARQPGLRVRFNFAGSQQLAIQLEQGATAEVFASADERWMTYVKERELLIGEPVEFARNHLVVIVPKTNPARIKKLQDLARPGVKMVLAADAVPVGRYSRQALQAMSRDPAFGSDYSARVLRNLASEEENVRSVVGKVQLGEADAGIVYRSDVTPSLARFITLFPLTGEADIVASYPIATLKSGAAAELGQVFVDLVLSEEGQKVLQSRGLTPVAAAAKQP